MSSGSQSPCCSMLTLIPSTTDSPLIDKINGVRNLELLVNAL